MKNLILIALLSLGSLSVMAQDPTPASTPKDANPADVSTLDGIMKAVYDVISGDAGVSAIGIDSERCFIKMPVLSRPEKTSKLAFMAEALFRPRTTSSGSSRYLPPRAFTNASWLETSINTETSLRSFRHITRFAKRTTKKPFFEVLTVFSFSTTENAGGL